MRRQGILYLEQSQSLNADPHTTITSPGQKSNGRIQKKPNLECIQEILIKYFVRKTRDETPTSVITRCKGCENTETDIWKKETTPIPKKSQDCTFKTKRISNDQTNNTLKYVQKSKHQMGIGIKIINNQQINLVDEEVLHLIPKSRTMGVLNRIKLLPPKPTADEKDHYDIQNYLDRVKAFEWYKKAVECGGISSQ
ncbi:4245_t:CDS:2 [Diversispora eburnea]|uniref:4245_t:CDS:1 n=1 Tax=Diversispora eburnea TaxID=1213867 RepID=A0A9N9ABT1_9GLOM|nr:4245_t:CDS:2 [Diversispora eburnea]